MNDPIKRAADYIQTETDKLDAGVPYAACLSIARHLHHLWSGKPESKYPTDVAHKHRQRYEGDAWDNGND